MSSAVLHLAVPDLLRIVYALLKQKDWKAAALLMVELLRVCGPQQAIPIRLKLAHIMISVEQRPRQGLTILAKIPRDLSAAAKANVQKLRGRAQRMIDDGMVELDLQDW